jgi:pyruvate formate lyase activating enzyme
MHGTTSSSPSGLVFNVQRFSIHDGPGIRTTVFLKGCPADCWWCHNPEARGAVPGSLEGAAESASDKRGGEAGAHPTLDSRWMAPGEVAAAALRDEIFYRQSGGGVTFSGGEPLAQAEFLLACLEALGRHGIHRAIDTSGLTSKATLLRVAEHAELFLYDLKLLDEVRHKRYVGLSNGRVVENLQELARAGVDVWLRTPVVPGVNDDRANLAALAELVGSLERPYPLYLLPYHRIGTDKYHRLGESYRLDGLEPPSRSRMAEIAAYLRHEGLNVHVGRSPGAGEPSKVSAREA